MSFCLNKLQEFFEQFVGKATAEILFNSLIGAASGYIVMKFAKSSALVIGGGLIAIEFVGETITNIPHDKNVLEEFGKTLLECLSLDEIYRRFAGRGFVGGMLIGISLA